MLSRGREQCGGGNEQLGTCGGQGTFLLWCCQLIWDSSADETQSKALARCVLPGIRNKACKDSHLLSL